jgi:hypothetical protein
MKYDSANELAFAIEDNVVLAAPGHISVIAASRYERKFHLAP